MTEKMRKALENARGVLKSTMESDVIKPTMELLNLIDEALAEPEVVGTPPGEVARLIHEAYEEGKSDSGGSITTKLLELPGQLEAQAFRLADRAIEIEKLRAKIATKKMQAMEQITDLKENGKPKYSNAEARASAQVKMLADDAEYLKDCDELGRLEYQQKLEEIGFSYLRDTFRAQIAIAGMRQ